MEYRIKKSISSQIKESYATGTQDNSKNIEIDCSEGINLVSFSLFRRSSFNKNSFSSMPQLLSPITWNFEQNKKT